jgi:hypothetical protein
MGFEPTPESDGVLEPARRRLSDIDHSDALLPTHLVERTRVDAISIPLTIDSALGNLDRLLVIRLPSAPKLADRLVGPACGPLSWN